MEASFPKCSENEQTQKIMAQFSGHGGDQSKAGFDLGGLFQP